ncbi:MAG: GDSL-type esterase/lipase family protein [Acidimicrobiia bacterium]
MNAWKFVRPSLAASAYLAGQMAHAIRRDDLPSLANQDPSGTFGEPDAPPLGLVFLGDSSITSPGVEPLDASWPRQIGIHLGERFHVRTTSLAVGGSKARDVLANQLEQAISLSPDIAYLSVGSNDALRGTPVPRFESEYDRIVARLHAAVPAVGLSGVGDLGTIPRFPEVVRGVARIRARAMDRAIARVAARYPHAVKSNAWDVMHPWFEEHPSMFAGDLFHASASGHMLFASVARPVADHLVDLWQSQSAPAITERSAAQGNGGSSATPCRSPHC